jgi:hypothetical protein
MPDKPPVCVTRAQMPELKEFLPFLEQIWESRVLTNGGPFHQQLEAALAEHLTCAPELDPGFRRELASWRRSGCLGSV